MTHKQKGVSNTSQALPAFYNVTSTRQLKNTESITYLSTVERSKNNLSLTLSLDEQYNSAN